MSRTDQKIERLGQVPLFRACTRKQLKQIAQAVDELTAEDGVKIVREGEYGREMYVLESGKAVVARAGREVAALGPGDFFGELSLLDQQPRNATVSASGEVKLICIGQQHLHALLTDVPGLTQKLLAGLARRLHEFDTRPA